MTADAENQPLAEEEKIQEKELVVPFPETYIYTNATALSTSFQDVRIGFAEALPDGTAHARVGVVMPVEHAAQLVLNMLHQLNVFERNFGEIRHPAWRAAKAKTKTGPDLKESQKAENP